MSRAKIKSVTASNMDPPNVSSSPNPTTTGVSTTVTNTITIIKKSIASFSGSSGSSTNWRRRDARVSTEASTRHKPMTSPEDTTQIPVVPVSLPGTQAHTDQENEKKSHHLQHETNNTSNSTNQNNTAIQNISNGQRGIDLQEHTESDTSGQQTHSTNAGARAAVARL
jgi:hypothetical protein